MPDTKTGQGCGTVALFPRGDVTDAVAYGGVKRPHPTIHSRHVYNSQPSRLQNSRHVYKTTVTPTIHSRHVYKTTVKSTIYNLFCRRDGCELQT